MPRRAPLILCSLAAVLLAACADKLTVEQQIIATLHTMEEAAENGKHFEFMEYVADSFSGQNGVMDRREFHRFMVFQINRNRRLHGQFLPIHVEETGADEALARFKLLVTGGGSLLPERGQLFAVETHWLRAGGDWLLARADWKALRIEDVPGLELP